MSSGLVGLAHGSRSLKIGVVGDLILDRYLRGDARRISPEAPIPVLAVGREDVTLGGAGNVVANMLDLDSAVWVGGVVGDDDNGRELCEALKSVGADIDAVIRDSSRPTVEKVRLIAQSQQILRFDREDAKPVAGDVEQSLVDRVRDKAAQSDVIVVSDYAKGCLTAGVLKVLMDSPAKIFVDPKGSDYSKYRGAYCITPNRNEAESATQVSITDDDSLREAAARLFSIVEGQVVVITLGADGVFCANRDGSSFHVRAKARKVYDVTGAGDTVIALLARYLGAGLGLEEAVRIANAGAGVVVGKLGAAPVTVGELHRALQGEHDESAHKVLSEDELEELSREMKAEGLRVVFTNGCFDLLHAGHARYLSAARAQGDVLIVGLNDDASIGRLKGDDRPIVPLEDRAALLASLTAVDFVVPFSEDTPEKVIEMVSPDVLVKGADWKDKTIVGQEWVEAHGGKLFLAPVLEGRSTSGLLAHIRKL